LYLENNPLVVSIPVFFIFSESSVKNPWLDCPLGLAMQGIRPRGAKLEQTLFREKVVIV
jgi:hypothetical protein